MTHVNVHSSVRAIESIAFADCRVTLAIVILNDEPEEIGDGAFAYCTSIGEIVIPNAVGAIKEWPFRSCTGLTIVTLGDGLEVIEEAAFDKCRSLRVA